MRRIALYITLTVLAVALVVVSVPNITALMGRAYHSDDIEQTLRRCRRNTGMVCQYEDTFEGLVWVGYDVVGE